MSLFIQGSGGGGGGGSGASTIQAGTANITSGAASVVVTFATVFPNAPSVQAVVLVPSEQDAVFTAVSNVTTSGFTALLSASVPATGYVLQWQAASA